MWPQPGWDVLPRSAPRRLGAHPRAPQLLVLLSPTEVIEATGKPRAVEDNPQAHTSAEHVFTARAVLNRNVFWDGADVPSRRIINYLPGEKVHCHGR